MSEEKAGSPVEEKKQEATSRPVIVQVGKCAYETTDKILMDRSGEDGTLTRMVKEASANETIDCNKDALSCPLILKLGDSFSGKLFYYVLFYLQFGILPGGKSHATCYLDAETLTELKHEAVRYKLKELENICQTAADPYVSFGEVGDLDKENYSDFVCNVEDTAHRYGGYVEWNIAYKYKEHVKVLCWFNFDSNHESSVTLSIYADGAKLIDGDAFCALFRKFEDAIKNEGCKTVTQVYGKVEVYPEAQLVLAFVVSNLLEYFSYYKNFDYEFGDSGGDGPFWFLFSDTTWPMYKK
jgi:hypothetical protein